MATFTTDDVTRLAQQLEEIKELKAFVIQRAAFYLLMEKNKTVDFTDQNGCVTEIANYELFNPDAKIINVNIRDDQYGGVTQYQVPRDFVFGPKTKKEEDFEEFTRLKNQFAR